MRAMALVINKIFAGILFIKLSNVLKEIVTNYYNLLFIG